MSDYNGSVIRAIRGPVILITIGGLFALNNFTRYRFDQTWPVILIVFGLMSLLRRGVETSPPPPPPPPPSQPRGYTATGYSQSPYSQAPPAPASTPGSTSEPAKGGFGSSATPRASDAPPSTPGSGAGGTA
ncbi:MAG: DUF5668 domain-containing protein [Bryobacteraceae bacterium]|jgi:hypothetical protein